MSVDLHSVLDEAERQLRSTANNIGFAIHTNATRGEVPSYYESQFCQTPPMIVYNAEQGLYYFTQGPRVTPGKRDYPVRYLPDGKLDGPQPEFYYSTTQQVEFTPIIEAISPTQYRVFPEAAKGWPNEFPFYLHLVQKIEDTYRYTKTPDKIRVVGYADGVITLSEPLALILPVEGSADWADYIKNPAFFTFFERQIDGLISDDPKISDEELAIELFGTTKSLRPHTAHLLSPLKAPSYASGIYGNTWFAPLPYPEDTTVKDGDEATVNGFLCDKISDHRMVYDSGRNSWNVGGVVFCICYNFRDAGVVEDCFLNYQFRWYFKLKSLQGNHHLYNLAVTTWV